MAPVQEWTRGDPYSPSNIARGLEEHSNKKDCHQLHMTQEEREFQRTNQLTLDSMVNKRRGEN